MEKITPIKRKGCVNAGWKMINGEKVVVKLNPLKKIFKFVTKRIPIK